MDTTAAALADPVRRKILLLLRDGPRSAGAIARRFARISRPAVSRHLRVLRHAGLVRDQVEGRRRFYGLDPTPLGELEAFIVQLRDAEARWGLALDALETEVHRTRRERRGSATRPQEKSA